MEGGRGKRGAPVCVCVTMDSWGEVEGRTYSTYTTLQKYLRVE